MNNGRRNTNVRIVQEMMITILCYYSLPEWSERESGGDWEGQRQYTECE